MKCGQHRLHYKVRSRETELYDAGIHFERGEKGEIAINKNIHQNHHHGGTARDIEPDVESNDIWMMGFHGANCNIAVGCDNNGDNARRQCER